MKERRLSRDQLFIFGKNISKFRKSKKIKQDEFATKIGYNKGALSTVECGHAGVSLPTMLEICNQLEIEPNDLFDGLFQKQHDKKLNVASLKAIKNKNLTVQDLIDIIEKA